MTTSSRRLPGKSSRTSTQAITVPITTLIAVTISAWVTVSRRAAAVCGLVSVSRNVAQPPSIDWITTRHSGISTSRLNHVNAMPRPMPEDRVSGAPLRVRRLRAAPGAGAVSIVTTCRTPPAAW